MEDSNGSDSADEGSPSDQSILMKVIFYKDSNPICFFDLLIGKLKK